MKRLVAVICLGAVAGAVGIVPAAPVAGAAPPAVNGKIAFTAHTSGGDQVFTVDPDGSGLFQVTHLGSGSARNPSWSPDGTKIAFGSDVTVTDPDTDQPTDVGQIFDVYANGASPINRSHTSVDSSHPAWSPSGGEIAYQRQGPGYVQEIHVMTYANPTKDGVGYADATLTTSADDGHEPAWDPYSGRIAFMGRRDGNWEIYSMTREGLALTRLTDDAGWDGDPAWSPDGTEIAWVSSRAGNAAIWVMGAGGANPQQLTFPSSYGLDSYPAWSPDGRFIAFTRSVSGATSIWVMNADGSNPHKIADSNATLGPTSVSWGRRPVTAPPPQTITCPKPRLKGKARVHKALRVVQAKTHPGQVRVHRTWWRGKKRIKGVTGRVYHLEHRDAGKRVKVRVACRAPGLKTVTRTSKARLIHR